MASSAKRAPPSVAGTSDWTKYGSGELGNLSKEQEEILRSFVGKVSKEDMEAVRFRHETPDSVSARFLRARKYDQEAALEMFKNAAQFRRKMKVDELAKMDTEDVAGCSMDEMYKFYQAVTIESTDKLGRPLYFDRVGEVDVDGMLTLTTQEKLLRNHIAYNESLLVDMLERATIKAGRKDRPVDSVCCIMDLSGFGLGKLRGPTVGYTKQVTRLDQDYYPETMGACIIINAPTVFSVAWKMLKGFLDPRTVAKITVCSGSGIEELLKVVDKDNLPVEYGGNLKIPGGLFPQSRTMDAVINSGKQLEWDVPATVGRSTCIKWFPRGGSIKFGVTFVPEGETEGTVVVEPATVDGSEYRKHDMGVATKAGTYKVVFDNYANWTSRSVFYRYDVSPDPAEKAKTEDKAATTTAADADTSDATSQQQPKAAATTTTDTTDGGADDAAEAVPGGTGAGGGAGAAAADLVVL